MAYSPDHLYELLPVIHRVRDAKQGYPLRALLRVINEQVKVVEDDIAQLYENWFIETCQGWVAPYIGELIGYHPVHEAGEPGPVTSHHDRQRNKILIPRREIAKTVYYRRRKGTLALLETLSQDVAGWPARAIEFYKLLGWLQNINHLRLSQGRTVDIRNGEALDQLDGPFDTLAHTVDVRRIASNRGRYNLPNVGVFVWRLRTYSMTEAPAYRLDENPRCFTFNIIGNNQALYNKAQPEPEPTHIAGELNLPVPIRRRRFEAHLTDYYGEGKSLQIWVGKPMIPELVEVETERPASRSKKSEPKGQPRRVLSQRQVVLPEKILPANLSDWDFEPPEGYVAVDPELGRIAFSSSDRPSDDETLWVSYQYGFSAEIGGGEYDRPLSQSLEYNLYRVGEREQYPTLSAALLQWESDRQSVADDNHPVFHAVIEIGDNQVYEEPLEIVLRPGQVLQIRAANRVRPVLSGDNRRKPMRDVVISAQMAPGSRLILDGLYILGAVQIKSIDSEQMLEEMAEPDTAEEADASDAETPTERTEDSLDIENDEIIYAPAQALFRHCTLVPHRPKEDWHAGGHHVHGHADFHHHEHIAPSLYVETQAHITIEHSILGAITVTRENEPLDPGLLFVSDSIVDATSSKRPAIISSGKELIAGTALKMARSTVIGEIHAHAIELAENCIFNGTVTVARRQIGCMRFCYVADGSRTPQRYECQPEQAELSSVAKLRKAKTGGTLASGLTQDIIAAVKRAERGRVRPYFVSKRFGDPGYCQLTLFCAEEITRGAEDESEMGVFHDLYQPQRAANLQARLNEYTPAGMEVGVLYAN